MYTMVSVMSQKVIEKCGNCRHYREAYCNLMDELVEPLDNCGMFDNGDEQ